MFVQCFVNTNYDGWDNFGGICKIGDNFSLWICWRWLWKAWMTTSTLGRPPSWSSLALALRTFTLVLGLSGPVSPPPWPSCLPSSCTRSSKPGIVRIQLSLEFSIVFRYSLTITLWSRTHQHGILSANTTSRMESSANGKRLFVVGLRLDLYTFYTLGISSIFGCRFYMVTLLSFSGLTYFGTVVAALMVTLWIYSIYFWTSVN